MESMYQKWLSTEAEWIGSYCRRTRKNSLLKITPLTLALSALLFGGLAVLGDGIDGLLTGVAGGLVLGGVVCTFYLAILFVSLRPKRYIRKIEQCVQEAGIGEMEQEQLGQEMLDALEHEEQVMSYEMWGPNVKGTPARLLITHNYVFQEGALPMLFWSGGATLRRFGWALNEKRLSPAGPRRKPIIISPSIPSAFTGRTALSAGLMGRACLIQRWASSRRS